VRQRFCRVAGPEDQPGTLMVAKTRHPQPSVKFTDGS
jgi:hypothetical protein